MPRALFARVSYTPDLFLEAVPDLVSSSLVMAVSRILLFCMIKE